MPIIDREVDAGVAIITLNDPVNGNRLNYESLQELSEAFESSAEDGQSRVILLRSAADVFCLGMDLVKLRSEGIDRIRAAISFYVELLARIHSCTKPVICLLDGDVKAGGVGLVCACDIVLSTARSTFELGEVVFGLIPANVLPYLFSLRVSPQKARYLILTSKKIEAQEALRLGLVDELFADSDFEKGIRAIIKRLFRSSPFALAEAKLFTNELLGRSLDQIRSLARDKFLELTGRPEAAQAISAFNEGGTPEWFARYKPDSPLIPRRSGRE